MNATCPVCFRQLPPPGPLVTTIAAGGKGLVRVHSGQCATVVGSAARSAGGFALYAGRRFLATKAPRISALLESFAAYRRAQHPPELGQGGPPRYG